MPSGSGMGCMQTVYSGELPNFLYPFREGSKHPCLGVQSPVSPPCKATFRGIPFLLRAADTMLLSSPQTASGRVLGALMPFSERETALRDCSAVQIWN